MELLPLSLKAIRGNWQRFIARKRNEAFIALQAKVLARDDKTCRFCGFQSDQFQEVVNLDNNYSNNQINNLMTCCCFCAQCFFLDGIGQPDAHGGSIIYLPEVSQADLHHFCRMLFCSMLRDVPYKGKLQATYLSLQDRGSLVEQQFGPNTQSASVFGQAIIDSQLTEVQQNYPIMRDLRLLPIRKSFKTQIEYWRNTVFAKIPL